MAMSNPSNWAANWGQRVGQSGQKWASNLNAVASTIGAKAAAAAPNWQQAVASPAALQRYESGVQNINVQQFTASVSGPGMTKYTSAGTIKQAKFSAFAQAAGAKWPGMLASLPARGSRGSAQNQQRMIAWSTSLTATRGQY
jgi:hypothetical protein